MVSAELTALRASASAVCGGQGRGDAGLGGIAHPIPDVHASGARESQAPGRRVGGAGALRPSQRRPPPTGQANAAPPLRFRSARTTAQRPPREEPARGPAAPRGGPGVPRASQTRRTDGPARAGEAAALRPGGCRPRPDGGCVRVGAAPRGRARGPAPAASSHPSPRFHSLHRGPGKPRASLRPASGTHPSPRAPGSTPGSRRPGGRGAGGRARAPARAGAGLD